MKDTADIYTVASNAIVVWDVVEHELFEEYSIGLTALERALHEEKEDAVWIEVRRILRRVRSALSATPLPFCHTSFGVARACQEIEPYVSQAQAQYSAETARMLGHLVWLMECLAISRDNPLGDRVIALGSGATSVGLLLPVARHKESVVRFVRSVKSMAGVEVVTPKELANRRPFAGLLVAGSLQWYRDDRHVVISPRAQVVHLLRWSWMRDSLPDTRLFAASRIGRWTKPDSPPTPSAQPNLLDGSDLVPRIDWGAITDKVGASDEPRTAESVAARVLMLTGGRAVAVSAARGTIHVVEPELEGAKRIREAEVHDLEVGDFVLLRSQGGGDLVVEVANQELGDSASALRALQDEWKAALRARVTASTYTSVATQLQRLGTVRANAQNLRNWMSPRSLKTASIEDFSGIMKLIGREADTDRFWEAMTKLDNAHRKAGHSIRRMLISVVASSDLRRLESEGTMEFQLPAQGGGRLTAFRIEAIAPEFVDVAENRVGRLVDAGDLWLE